MSGLARRELRRAAPSRPSAVTVGVFDGVHLGHRHLFTHLTNAARTHGLAPGAVTLDPDPVKVLHPERELRYLTSLEERMELLEGCGLDFVALLTFTPELAALTPAGFARLLREELDMRLLLMGPDNAFGRNREGTPAVMARSGRDLGFDVEVIEPLLVDGREVHATDIREALARGDLAAVERYLGRRYSIQGPVVKGDQRGRELGFPTANIAVAADRALPAFGVYATWAYLGEARYPSATSIGVRPQFGGLEPSVETFILDFGGDIYGQTLKIELVERLSPEMKFETLEELKAKIAEDVAKARTALAGGLA
jgi:riboflavin kinase/FMN adenylyltransferase